MSWSDGYVGIPWRAGGRHDDGGTGLDCWGLLRRVYAERLEIELQSFAATDALDGVAIAAQMESNIDGWRSVARPRPFDGVLLRKGRSLCHVGVLVQGALFLHVDENLPACIERLDAPVWRRRFMGFYRYR